MSDLDCRMLTQKEAARLIGRNEKVVRGWVQSGQLPTIREGDCGRHYILRITLFEFVRSLESGILRNVAED